MTEVDVYLQDRVLEGAIKRLTMLMETGYLPRQMYDDLQCVRTAAIAWQIIHNPRKEP